jgi:hypothetical protein
VADNDLLSTFFRDYLRPLRASETFRQVLEASNEPLFRPADMTPMVSANPFYTKMILSLSFLSEKLSQWEADGAGKPDHDQQLIGRIAGLMGKAATRNVIACIRLLRVTNPQALPRKEGDRLTLTISQLISMAVAAEEFFQEQKIPHSDKGFLAGLHYDWLKAIMTAKKAPKDASTVLGDAYKEGQRLAQIAHEIGTRVEKLPNEQFLCAAAWVLPLGQALMAVRFPKGGGGPSWNEFQTECAKNPLNHKHPGLAERYLENRRFGVTHADLNALYVSAFGILAPVEKAIGFYRTPWYLERSCPEQLGVAMVLSIASTLSQKGQKKGESAPLWFSSFHREWMKKNRLTENTLVKIQVRSE